MFIAQMILRIYEIACCALAPLVPGYLNLRVARGKEMADRLMERYGQARVARPDGLLLWCHGASVGESLSILPILDKLHQERPDISILMTTGTVTSACLMAERLPAGAIHQFIPLDHPVWTQKFLTHWHPDCILWLESEFWPCLLLRSFKQQAVILLINGRMSAASFKRWQKIPWFMPYILSGFDLCLGQEQADCHRFKALGAHRVESVGNLKFASPPLPVKQADLDQMVGQLAGRPCWVAASTHSGEERQIVQAHQRVQEVLSDCLCIIIPRHPHRGVQIQAEIETTGLSSLLRSQQYPLTQETDVYIVDSLGELGLFYRLAPLAFIGGSLIAHGGHNPLEPALLQTAILYGPHMENFKEIDSLLSRECARIAVSSAEDLGQSVCELLQNPEACQHLQQKAAATVRGAQENIQEAFWQKILPFLPT